MPARVRCRVISSTRLPAQTRRATDQLERYDASGSKRRQMPQLRQFIGIRPLDKAGSSWLDTVATAEVQTKHTTPDTVNVLLKELVHHRYELPGFPSAGYAVMRLCGNGTVVSTGLGTTQPCP